MKDQRDGDEAENEFIVDEAENISADSFSSDPTHFN